MNPKRLAIWRAFFVLRSKKTKRKLKTTNLHAFTLQNVKKHAFPHPQPQKRVRKLLSALHSYARNRFTIDFARSVYQTGQNCTFPSLETVNGARNFFACREALSKRKRASHLNADRRVGCRSALRRSAHVSPFGQKHISAHISNFTNLRYEATNPKQRSVRAQIGYRFSSASSSIRSLRSVIDLRRAE